jgi:pyruvyl transferase EpsO
VVQELAARARRVLSGLLGERQGYALVDFPNHSNVGDSAIWVGEVSALAGIGLGPPRYVADLATFSPATLRARVGDGPVLIHGGGNLGDLWPRHQQLREHVVLSSPRNPVIQLPQSIEFRSPEAEERARAVFEGHGAFTLLARDERSLSRARESLGVDAVLCPDLAFCLPPMPPPAPPERWPASGTPQLGNGSAAAAGCSLPRGWW